MNYEWDMKTPILFIVVLCLIIQFCTIRNVEASMMGSLGTQFITKPPFMTFAKNIFIPNIPIAKKYGLAKSIFAYNGRAKTSTDGEYFCPIAFDYDPFGDFERFGMIKVIFTRVILSLNDKFGITILENSWSSPRINDSNYHSRFIEFIQTGRSIFVWPFYRINKYVCSFDGWQRFRSPFSSVSGPHSIESQENIVDNKTSRENHEPFRISDNRIIVESTKLSIAIFLVSIFGFGIAALGVHFYEWGYRFWGIIVIVFGVYIAICAGLGTDFPWLHLPFSNWWRWLL